MITDQERDNKERLDRESEYFSILVFTFLACISIVTATIVVWAVYKQKNDHDLVIAVRQLNLTLGKRP